MSAYNRTAAMAWLHREHHWAGFSGPDFFDLSVTGRQHVITFLERACDAMHKRGACGHWAYSLPLHAEHVRILDAERAALGSRQAFADCCLGVAGACQSALSF